MLLKYTSKKKKTHETDAGIQGAYMVALDGKDSCPYLQANQYGKCQVAGYRDPGLSSGPFPCWPWVSVYPSAN